MTRLKHFVEYVALRIISLLVNLVSQPVAVGIGTIMASIAYPLIPFRRREARRRIRQVFGDQLTEDQVRRIAWHSFRGLVWHFIEILRTPKIGPAWVQTYVEFADQDRARLNRALELGKGAILAVPHLANWDIAGIGLQQSGYSMTFIVRQQKNPLFDRYLNGMREFLDSEVIERDDPLLLRKAIRALRKGNIVAILIDLRSRQSDLQIEFLGHLADLSRGLGIIAHMSGAPVVPAYATRLPEARHQWHFQDYILADKQLDRSEDAKRIVEAALVPLEQVIRDHAEQYFWFNKRWVLEPLPDSIRPLADASDR